MNRRSVQLGPIVCHTADDRIGRWLGAAADAVIPYGAFRAESSGRAGEPAHRVNWRPASTRDPGGVTALPHFVEEPEWRWEGVTGGRLRERPLFRHRAADGAVWLESSRSALVHGTPDPGDPAWRALAVAALFELMVDRGRLTLHAAAVALEGRGYALFGPSGAGKSTLAALAARGGATYVADDLVLLDRDDGGWRAWGMGRGIRLHPESGASKVVGPVGRGARGRRAAGGGQSASASRSLIDDRGKIRLDPASLDRTDGRPIDSRRTVGIDVLVRIPGHEGGSRPAATRWEPVPHDRALTSILPEAALALAQETVTRQLERLADLARLPLFELHPGRDLLDRPEAVASMLRRIGAAAPAPRLDP